MGTAGNLEFIHKIIGIQVSGTKICLVYFGYTGSMYVYEKI